MMAYSLKVETQHFDIECPPHARTWTAVAEQIAARRPEGVPIRLIIVGVHGRRLTVEASFAFSTRAPRWPSLLAPPTTRPKHRTGPSVVVNLIPTGVRAEIGGYAGDATPVTNLLATTCDYLVSNPNTVTASDLYFASDNVQYVEGNLICRFMLGQLDLLPQRRQPVGLVVEQPRDARFLRNVHNAINAMRAVAGTTIAPVVVSEGEIRTRCTYSKFGHASGEYGALDELDGALEHVVDEGVGAIGLVTSLDVPEAVRTDYYSGVPLPNPWGSAEAILTHLTTTYHAVTAAHSPLLLEAGHTMFGTLGDPRDGAELISSAYLCSMVRGLSQSPAVVDPGQVDALSVGNVRAVVMPESAVGNIPFLTALERRIPVIVVSGNRTIQDLTPSRLGVAESRYQVHTVHNYAEAAGLLTAMREGMDLSTIRRPFAGAELTRLYSTPEAAQ